LDIEIFLFVEKVYSKKKNFDKKKSRPNRNFLLTFYVGLDSSLNDDIFIFDCFSRGNNLFFDSSGVERIFP